jgi:hypothetical protein
MIDSDSKAFLDSEQYGGSDGLTKLEYFSELALQGILANSNDIHIDKPSVAVSLAEDLITELNERYNS